jgi:hypothetical protein
MYLVLNSLGLEITSRLRSECPILLVRLKLVVLGMQALERLLAVLGEVRFAYRRYGSGEEPRLPLFV